MQDKTSNHALIPTELNIAPRGKSWLHGQLIDGGQGHPTRQSMESADRAQPIQASPAQAAPAAVAVPDAVRDAEKLLRAEAARLDRLYGMNKWYGFCAEKASRLEHLRVADALAATPAAAAPVVLPKPDFWVRPGATIHPDRGWQCWSNDGTATGAFHADTVRALLAGVSAPAAQAVEKSDTFGMNIGQRILHVGGRENAQTYIEFGSVAAVRALVHQVLRDLPDGAPGFAMPAPQAQAAARDAAPAASGQDAKPLIARSLAEWHEDDGPVSWWAWCGREWAGEAAWIGTPNCDNWPGYHTHWTAHPEFPTAIAAQAPQQGSAA